MNNELEQTKNIDFLFKEDIQKLVFQDGEMIKIDDFEWNGESKTFKSKLNDLFLNFSKLDDVTLYLADYCIVYGGFNYTVACGKWCKLNLKGVCRFINNPKWCHINIDKQLKCNKRNYHNSGIIKKNIS